MKTIEQIIRDNIGSGGPQLPSAEYNARINEMLEELSKAELLELISYALEERLGGRRSW
ncbi:hypothetical protein [Brucella anthropi]|uniref:hypothetical protein n=1 Tax=Brucella anthropi TaxID=529 RepID=UPI00163A21B4|nr:hypothetical protein [Brucella anthropi]